MLSPEWLMATGVIAIAGFSIATYVRVGKGEKDSETKRGRLYERLDEVKEINKTEFVSQPVCDVKYLGVIKLLDEIKLDVKKILANGHKEKQ